MFLYVIWFGINFGIEIVLIKLLNFLDKHGVLVTKCSVIWFPYFDQDITVATRSNISAYFGSRGHLNYKRNDEYQKAWLISGRKVIFCKLCEDDGTIYRRERGKRLKNWRCFYQWLDQQSMKFEELVTAKTAEIHFVLEHRWCFENYYMPKPLVISERF